MYRSCLVVFVRALVSLGEGGGFAFLSTCGPSALSCLVAFLGLLRRALTAWLREIGALVWFLALRFRGGLACSALSSLGGLALPG